MRVQGRRVAAAAVVAALVTVLGGLLGAGPAVAQVNPNITGTLSLFKRIENLDTGSGEGRRELWIMHAVNTEDPSFSFTGDGLNGFQTRTIPAGTYTISESGGVAGYRFVSWDCGAAGVFTVPTPTITVPANNQVTCTVRNDAIKPTLTLVKVSGGPAAPTAWTLHANGPTSISGITGVSAAVPIGQYTLSESNGPPGYTASAWVCTGGTQTSGSTVVLTLGETVTCTITNTRTATAQHLLTLQKVVAGGPATTANFTLTASGTGATLSGTSGSPEVTAVPVPSGAYALSETASGAGSAGYAASAWTCTGGTVTGGTLTLADTDTNATCTITNTWTGGTLTLVKQVVGGTDLPTAWTLTAAGPTTITGRTGQPAVTAAQVPAGTFTLSETGPSNYNASPWSCTSGGSGATVTVTAGATITCTIVNTIQTASLTLVKQVDNTGGGTATVGAFTLTGVDAAGGLVMTGTSGSPPVTDQIVPVGSTWALSETSVPGYAASAWTCTGATATNDTVTITSVADVVCTVTNTWHGGFLTLVKQVAGDAAPPDAWTLTATGAVTIAGPSGAAAVTGVAVPSGAYVLSESTVGGFAGGAWDCGGAPLAGATVTVTDGTDVECTITNTPTQPHLTLAKIVDNSAGGTLPATTWTLTAAGPTPLSGVTGTPAVTLVAVAPGSYTLSESPSTTPGYAAAPWACSSTGTPVTVVGETVTIPATAPDGSVNTSSVSCSITNTAISPQLTLVKLLDNSGGGVASPEAFTLIAASPLSVIAGSTGTPAVTDAPVPVGTYKLLEIGLQNYISDGWSCVDAAGNPIPLVGGSSIALALGDDVTCTLANHFALATLTLVKQVAGGPASAADWTLTAAGVGGGGFAGISGSPEATSVVHPGVFRLSEVARTTTARLGYRLVGWTCDGGHTVTGGEVTIAVGETVVCTGVNEWIGSSLTLTKAVDGGTALPSAWTLTAEGPVDVAGPSGSDAVTAVGVVPGTYALAESGPAGYQQVGWTCDGATLVGNQVTVGEQGVVSCTVTNRAEAVVTPPPTPPATSAPGGEPGPDSGVLSDTGSAAGALAALALLATSLGVVALAAARRGRWRRQG